MARYLKRLPKSYCTFSADLQRQVRQIMTSSFCAEKALEELEVNPYYEKYAAKIASIKRDDPTKLLSRLQTLQEQKASTAKLSQESLSKEPEMTRLSAAVAPKPQVADAVESNLTKPKLLSSIMKIECVADKSKDDIKMIWEEYHKHKDVIAATMPFELMEKMLQFGKRFPTFLFPLPRNQGYEFILSQFSGNEVHFTPLGSYQIHKENAPECLTVVHFTELKEKGIVLMRGEYNIDIINAKEALCLANQLQLYYCTPDDKRIALMERFTLEPAHFQHMDLVAELECITTSLCLK